MTSLQELFREYAQLERRRTGDGVTPLEYQRWLDLGRRLRGAFSSRTLPGARGGAPRGATRMKVEYASPAALRDALMKNLAGRGIFVATPFAPETGTRFEICIHVGSLGRALRAPAEVVSTNIRGDYSTKSLGMGVRLLAVGEELRRLLDG